MFRIGKRVVGGQSITLIAEVGVNHLKDLALADRLVSAAARAGADMVKFQSYSAERLVTRDAPRYWSWSGEQSPDGSQFDSFEKLAVSDQGFTEELRDICTTHGVEFLSTPFDTDAVDMLQRVGVKAFKIASGDITNLPLLRAVGESGLPIFLSTGASDLAEIEQAVGVLEALKTEHICIMHCTLSYPTRPEDANLSAVRDIRKAFPRHVLGFSDHTLGPYIGAGSVLFGVDVIEKHFTVDRSLPGSADHWLSSDENELRLLRSMADEFRKARGSGRKTVLESEKAARANARRSLVARGPIPKGATFTPDNVIAKRPASGLSPMYFDSLVGLTTVKDLPDDAVIQAVDVAEDAPFKQITESTASEFRPKQ